MLVYRLHGADGRGIYRSNYDAVNRAQDLANFRERGLGQHPTPDGDRLLRPLWQNLPYGTREDWYFGCDSLESLGRWFFGSIGMNHLLREAGAYVGVYAAPNVIRGYSQVAFHYPTAKNLQRMDTDEVMAFIDANVGKL